MALTGAQPDWMLRNDERERCDTGNDKKATEMPMLMVRKWLNQNLPGTQKDGTMRDGRILFPSRDKATAQKAEMNSRSL
jgi:hypothetical protein